MQQVSEVRNIRLDTRKYVMLNTTVKMLGALTALVPRWLWTHGHMSIDQPWTLLDNNGFGSIPAKRARPLRSAAVSGVLEHGFPPF